MEHETQLNPDIRGEETALNPDIRGDATALNPEVHEDATALNPVLAVTEVNPALRGGGALEPGTELPGGYIVTGRLEARSGEADLYRCSKEETEFVAKLYRRAGAIKGAVVEALRAIDSPYVAVPVEVGVWDGAPFEILPYYRHGSLQGKRFVYHVLRSAIIPNINEALHILHQNRILHKDVKPSNIMRRDDKATVALIDFGISSLLEDDSTVLITKTGMTPAYSAPETFKNVFLEESDYYSFGITIYELFTGHTPYQNMSADEIAQYLAVQNVPFPEDMPQDLRELILGLTYSDLRNRDKKDNPNRRWTYEEVAAWCRGEKQVVPGEGVGEANVPMTPYSFQGTEYTEPEALFQALGENWEAGKRHLFRGLLSAHFRLCRPKIAQLCQEAENTAAGGGGSDDQIFWRLLMKLQPERKQLQWRGKSWENLPALGRDMLEKLRAGDESDEGYYHELFSQQILSGYAELAFPGETAQQNALAALEARYITDTASPRQRKITWYLAAFMLSGKQEFRRNELVFGSVEDLAKHLASLRDGSFEELKAFCHSLISRQGEPDLQLEAWLTALGRGDAIARWKESMQ